MRKSAQQVQRCGRLVIGLDHARGIGDARLRREGIAVDDIAAIAWQLDPVLRFGFVAARLGELPGKAAHLDHRQATGKGHGDSHLQHYTERIADQRRAELVEAFGAIAALQHERLAAGHLGQLRLQAAAFTGKDQRRIAAQRFDCALQRLLIGIGGQLLCGLYLPAFRGPKVCHSHNLSIKAS